MNLHYTKSKICDKIIKGIERKFVMEQYIQFKEANCKNCYKCIRSCPVKSIRFSGNQANIIADECILCGHCFVACPQNAKVIRNDTDKVRALIRENDKVLVSLAPSFAANFPGMTIESMKQALLKLGFFGVEETAIGATIVKKEYDRLVKSGEHNVIISTCCHTVNLLVQKHYPAALKYLAHVLSPMQAHCVDMKKRFAGAKTVFIGPCISKKAEAESYPGNVDAVLTFEELSEWLNGEKISIEAKNDTNSESKARLFPTTGGILRTMDCDREDFTYIAVDGIENCVNALEDILAGNVKNCFIEMSACVGSCIGGPAMEKAHRSPIKGYSVINRYAGKNDFPVSDYTADGLKKEMPSLAKQTVSFSKEAIDEVMRKIGKQSPADELNCGSCGYNSCRDKAAAVLMGKADLTMCLPYLKEKAESFSDNIIKNTPNAILVLNESFEIQTINSAAMSLLNVKRASDVVGNQVVCILDPTPFFEVGQTEKNVYEKQVYMAEYGRYVNQTVIHDKSFHIYICIMRDVTEEANQKREKEEIGRRTMEITDKVIEKQMRTVQEIALLLGETTAETKVALTKLKESLGNE